MQNIQIQPFRPPILVRRSYAIGVMERAFPFSLSFRIVCHISCSVLSDVSHTSRLTNLPAEVFASVSRELASEGVAKLIVNPGASF